jgi:hypothetical protein
MSRKRQYHLLRTDRERVERHFKAFGSAGATSNYNPNISGPSSNVIIGFFETPRLFLVKSIDVRLGEFSSGHLLCEEDIELLEGAILGLWKSKESPGKEDESSGAPEER